MLLEQKGTVNIVMHKDSVAADVLQAFLHALVMANLFEEYKSAHSESYSWMDKHYRNLVVKVLSGCPFSFIYGTRLQIFLMFLFRIDRE